MSISRRTIFFLLAGLILITYSNSLSNEFTGDDVSLFVYNDFYGHPANLQKIFSREIISQYSSIDPASRGKDLPYSGFVAYRPVTAVSFFTDSFVWGRNPTGFRLTNIFLHILVSFLLFNLFLAVFGEKRSAFLAAILFALHPVQAELINTAGYRSDLLLMLFASLVMISHIRREQGGGVVYRYLEFLAFALALFSKESAVILPFLLWIYDRLFLSSTKKMSSRLGTYGILTGITIIYLYVYFFVFPNATLTGQTGFFQPGQAVIALKTLAHYTTALFWPFNATVLPPLYWPDASFVLTREVIVVLCFVILSLLLLLCRGRREPAVAFFVFWFWLAYLPTSNVIASPSAIGYRFLYMPSAGFLAIAAFYIEKAVAKMELKNPDRRWGAIIRVLIVSLCVMSTFPLNEFYKNNIVLCREMLRRFPDSTRSYWILGLTYLEGGQYDKARGYFQGYLNTPERNPYVVMMKQEYFIHHQLGRCYVGDPGRAIAEFEKALALRPDYAHVYADMAKAYMLKKDYRRSLDIALKGIVLQKNLMPAYAYAVHAALELGLNEEALRILADGLKQDPEDINLKYLENRIKAGE